MPPEGDTMTDAPLPPGALRGLRVIDLSRVLGAPFCTQMLGDHGADVIKIEPPQGDETRGWGPPFREDGAAAYYLGLNRNKRGMALDLRQPAGREVLMHLLEGADVLVENFKTGTLESWGIGYEQTLAERFPRLIHCRVSGFGADGPLGGLPGYDAVLQAMGGHMSVNGEAGGEPLRVGLPVVDMVTGLNAAIAILLALRDRELTGQGQFVEASLFDGALSLLHPHGANWFLSGKVPERTGNAHPNICPYDSFPTATRPVYLTIGNDRQFQRLVTHIGRPDLAEDPRFATNADRLNNRDTLRAELVSAMATLDGTTLAPELIAQGVPAGAILDVGEALSQAHAAHREMVIEVDGEDGPYRGIGSPAKLSRSGASYRRPPPGYAAHTDEVLREAGLTDERIAALRAEGILPGRDRS
jgi:crotonobetainyl-CoA:carnitine CoA-transferase CaiB-like acyl-CoA transferase